jgi:hypothetical protein
MSFSVSIILVNHSVFREAVSFIGLGVVEQGLDVFVCLFVESLASSPDHLEVVGLDRVHARKTGVALEMGASVLPLLVGDGHATGDRLDRQLDRPRRIGPEGRRQLLRGNGGPAEVQRRLGQVGSETVGLGLRVAPCDRQRPMCSSGLARLAQYGADLVPPLPIGVHLGAGPEGVLGQPGGLLRLVQVAEHVLEDQVSR